MSKIVLPVGFSVGPRYNIADPPDPNMNFYEISLGDESIQLNDDETKVMAAATGDPDRHTRLEITRISVRTCLEVLHDGVAEPEPIIDHLMSMGLLVEFDPVEGTDDELADLFRRHRLYPTAEGLGATPEEPRRYRIGHGSVPVVIVDNLTFSIWAYSRNFTNLWDECADFASDREYVGEDGKPLNLTTEVVVRRFARSLPALIGSGTAFLDLAFT